MMRYIVTVLGEVAQLDGLKPIECESLEIALCQIKNLAVYVADYDCKIELTFRG